MKRALVVLVVALLCVPVSAGAAPTAVDLTVAKTKRFIYGYGTVAPARPGRPVRVRLSHDDSSGFRLVATKWDRLSERRRFGARFARPDDGTCRVSARFKTGAGRVVTDEHVFSCALPDFSTGSASITSDAALLHTVDIQIADDDAERAHGLMYRRWLGADKGMVFLFGGETSGSFYMKNTLLPLSIAFFDAAGRIVSIMDMEPCESDPCPLYNPGTSYRGALEVNQGAFEDWGVTEGDVVSVTED